MPTYDYICKNCGHKFEKFQNMSADLIKECPQCHGHVERKIGAGAGLMFKGSGFYITDYKNNQKSSYTTSEKKETNSKNTKSETKKAS